MAAPPDDLPWPELGNVSRGATRGNQGQKGVLGPPDGQGCCVLQLRVQPGVLAVRLNRKASDWYRTLDSEVNRALKLTKTYWRKARRRQDYDARADQDHMELHEWLQQLKDKTMSHLEVLMQKGDIQGPPYNMSDDLELTFLRKFIERQASGHPHNPRLRNQVGGAPFMMHPNPSVGDSPSPDSEGGFGTSRLALDHTSESSSGPAPPSSRTSISPTLRSRDPISNEATSSKQLLTTARAALSRTQKDTQDAFLRYTACLDAERQARQAVLAAEKRRDGVTAIVMTRNNGESGSRHSSEDRDDILAQRYTPEHIATDMNKPLRSWGEVNPETLYGPSAPQVTSTFDDDAEKSSRKHPRSWEPSSQQSVQDPYACDDLGMPPRKRIHPILPFDPSFSSSLPPSLSLS